MVAESKIVKREELKDLVSEVAIKVETLGCRQIMHYDGTKG